MKSFQNFKRNSSSRT